MPRSPRLGPASPPDLSAKASRKKASAEEEPAEELVLPVARPDKKKRRERASEEAAAPEELPQKRRKRQEGTSVEAAELPAAPVAAVCDTTLSPEDFRRRFHITAPREQQLPAPVQRFDDAPFSKKVRAALVEAGFPAPSPIQAQSWPVATSGADLVAVAKTGSGKTLGYLLPAFSVIASRTEGSSMPAALVLAPTRELVTQIEAESLKFGRCAKVTSLAVFGGAPKPPQVKAARKGADLLVATPGRLQDLMEMGAVSLGGVSFLVLDEADRMLDMGFEPEIAKILAETPATRQTLLFTATWPKAVKKIAAKYLREDFVHVNVGATEELAANTAVEQEFFQAGDEEKEEKLWRILADLGDDSKAIVFGNTKRRAEALMKAFNARGYEAAALHGDKQQWERERDLANFAAGRCWLLFATDVCARGLDIKDVTHVFNYDMARDVESYVHRIGRTGRAGKKGKSITFWNPAYDLECSPALVKIAKEAGQEVPDWLEKAAAKQSDVKNKAWRY
mmetsp:Transcript_27753/g.60683  ORF Transcript_27753/g.60683 Transcript_27753/m.60683 type:complete len:509 (-) Transcript_27753:103-1629(-)